MIARVTWQRHRRSKVSRNALEELPASAVFEEGAGMVIGFVQNEHAEPCAVVVEDAVEGKQGDKLSEQRLLTIRLAELTFSGWPEKS